MVRHKNSTEGTLKEIKRRDQVLSSSSLRKTPRSHVLYFRATSGHNLLYMRGDVSKEMSRFRGCCRQVDDICCLRCLIKGSNCDRSLCIQCSIDPPPSCSFQARLENCCRFIPSRNVKWQRKFPVFPNFQKKDNLERLTEIFEISFRKFSVPFDFEPEFSEILVEWNAPVDLLPSPVTIVFVDTRLWKTKHQRKRFQNFRQSHMLSTDRIEIHQSQPLV